MEKTSRRIFMSLSTNVRATTEWKGMWLGKCGGENKDITLEEASVDSRFPPDLPERTIPPSCGP